MVFLECYADFWEGGGQYIEEIEFVEDEQKRDPRLRAIIPMAPLEWGASGRADARSRCATSIPRSRHPPHHGVRQGRPRALTLSDGFIEGVNLLEKFGWSFDINPNYTQMDIIREFVPAREPRRADDPRPLRQARHQAGRDRAVPRGHEGPRQVPQHVVKLSDLPPYASKNWTEAELRPYIEATLEFFGPERTIYAGDYPILLQSTTLPQWVEVLDNAFADLGLSEAETRKIYRDNANAFYRLGL